MIRIKEPKPKTKHPHVREFIDKIHFAIEHPSDGDDPWDEWDTEQKSFISAVREVVLQVLKEKEEARQEEINRKEKQRQAWEKEFWEDEGRYGSGD